MGTEETIRFPVVFDSAQARQNASAFRSSLAGLGQTADQLRPKFAGLASTASAFGSIVGRINPSLGQFASIVGTAGSSVGGLGAALGGLGGILGAVALTGLGVFVDKLITAKKQTDSLKDAQEKLGNTLKDNLSILEETQKRLSTLERVRLGAGSINEQVADVERLQKLLSSAERRLAADVSAGGGADRAELVREISALRGRLLKAQQDLAFARQAQASEALQEGVFSEIEDKKPAKKADPFAPTGAGRAEFSRQQSAVAAAQKAAEEQARIEAELTKSIERELDARTRARLRALKASSKAENDRFQAEVQKAKDADKKLEEIDQKAEQRARATQNAIASGFATIGGSAISAFQAAAKGQKQSTREILSGVGDAMVAEGTRWLFYGLAQSLIPGGQAIGAPLIAIAGAEIAAGIALGAATSGGASKQASAAPARPISYGNSNQGSEGGSTTIVINSLFADEHIGELIDQSQRARFRKTGRAPFQPGRP